MTSTFWKTAQAHLPYLAGQPLPAAWPFGDNPALADELAALVLTGAKTATSSRYADYEQEQEPLPQVGQLNIILDGASQPVALIQTGEVKVLPFNQVGAEHALAEGEGDGSLHYWRQEHRRFWVDEPGNFDENTLVVTERFTLLFP